VFTKRRVFQCHHEKEPFVTAHVPQLFQVEENGLSADFYALAQAADEWAVISLQIYPPVCRRQSIQPFLFWQNLLHLLSIYSDRFYCQPSRFYTFGT
jgi:hypothetical protein